MKLDRSSNLCKQASPLFVTVTATGEKLTITDCRIGSFRSNWRLRDVDIYPHPTDETLCVTVGKGFKGGSDCTAVELRKILSSSIGRFGYIYS